MKKSNTRTPHKRRDTVGAFTILRRVGTRHRRALWLVRCPHCGNTCEKTTADMRRSASCGCMQGKGGGPEPQTAGRDAEIRRLYAEGVATGPELAARFGLCRQRVYQILRAASDTRG